MMNKIRSVFSSLFLLFLVVACGQDSNQNASNTANLPFQVAGELSSGTVVQEWITDAAIDLAQSLDTAVTISTMAAKISSNFYVSQNR